MTEQERLEIIEARRQYQREYQKGWRAANKEKVKAINARFYAKKAAEYKAEKLAAKEEEDKK